MIKKHVWVSILTAMALAASLAACGGSDDDAGPDPGGGGEPGASVHPTDPNDPGGTAPQVDPDAVLAQYTALLPDGPGSGAACYTPSAASGRTITRERSDGTRIVFVETPGEVVRGQQTYYHIEEQQNSAGERLGLTIFLAANSNFGVGGGGTDMYARETYGADGQLENHWTYDPPYRTELKAPAYGQLYTYSTHVTLVQRREDGSDARYEGERTIEYQYLGRERVSTPAGSFDTCKIKEVTRTNWDDGDKSVSRRVVWRETPQKRGITVRTVTISKDGQVTDVKVFGD